MYAILTVGLGFGDEGKGATVDYLTRALDADLVVRYCGGAQAGHNVQLPDGRRHTFSQFGAGALVRPDRPVPTYLAANVVIDPFALAREARHLEELGVVEPAAALIVHPGCLVSVSWHRTLNRLRELARGEGRHGSCGQGVGETRRYWLEHGHDAVFAADLRDPLLLRGKLELLRQRAVLQMQALLPSIPPSALADLGVWDVTAAAEAVELRRCFSDAVELSTDPPACRTAVFEGAQGVLLDEYRGFHPYTTWSTVTAQHAWELIEQMNADAVTVLGVTRAYATRHGAGPFPTYSPELTERLNDPGNPPNPWQGRLRCGWLDLPLLRYAAAATGPLDGLVVNHLDQLAPGSCRVCDRYAGGPLPLAAVPDLAWQSRLTERLTQEEAQFSPATCNSIVDQLQEIAPLVLTARGPTHQDRKGVSLPVRRRRPPRA